MAKTEDFPPLSVTGIGYVDGLLGANCRHSIGPGSGGFNPWEKYDSEANRIQEELERKQRALERRIRQTRRQVMSAKTGLDAAEDAATRASMQALYQRKARLLKRQNEDYAAYCKENGLRTKDERLAVAKWDRRQASAATAAARKAEREEREKAGSDMAQYERYRAVLGDEAPKDLAEFQRMKYIEPEQWESLKGFYRYKKAYPNSSRRFYDAQQELAAAGIKKGALVPAEPIRAYILPLEKGDGRRDRDPWHITKRMRERQVTDDALRGYVENARAMFIQWGDSRRLYLSDEGMCVTVHRPEEDDWLFKTAWTKHDFEADSEMIMELIRKYGL